MAFNVIFFSNSPWGRLVEMAWAPVVECSIRLVCEVSGWMSGCGCGTMCIVSNKIPQKLRYHGLINHFFAKSDTLVKIDNIFVKIK